MVQSNRNPGDADCCGLVPETGDGQPLDWAAGARAHRAGCRGSGTLYLSLWAAFSLYQLMPSGAAFAAMIVVTAFNGLMAWRQDAELLALYAIAGGLSTPLLNST